jgi:hypothetical protein
MTAVEFLESRITTLIPEDIGSQLMFKSNIKKAKAIETVESMRVEKLEILAKLLAKIWFHCDWKWESPNERVQQMLMQELGYYPFKDEDEMIQQTQIDDNLYKQAAKEIPGWKTMSVDGPTPMLEHLKKHLDSITPEQFNQEIDDIIAEQGEPFKVWECCGMEDCICEPEDDGLTDDEWIIKELKKEKDAMLKEISDKEMEKIAKEKYIGLSRDIQNFRICFIEGMQMYRKLLKQLNEK